MKTYIKISILISIILIVINCQGFKKKEKPLILQENYGKQKYQNDSLGVELQLNKFKSFKELLSRTEEILCNDSLPKITIRNENKIKTIYLKNPCWKNHGCILIKSRNSIDIFNDTIFKAWERYYSLDSLEYILEKDLTNYGKDPFYSDNPEKLLIRIYYTENGVERLPVMLDKVTDVYSKLDSTNQIKIWLEYYYPYIPPPPPSDGPQEIE